MKASLYLRQIAREIRGAGGRLGFFVACLGVGVAAVTAVAGLAAGLEGAIRGEARQLLAADLAVASRRPIPAAVEVALDRPGLELARAKELATVVAAAGAAEEPGRPPASALVELKAVDGPYPFYGRLETDPPGLVPAALADDEALASPDLLERLGLGPGAILLVGGERFRVVGRVLSEPDRIGGAFTLGPRLFVSFAGLERAGLERFGSRILHRLLARLPAETGATGARDLAAELRELEVEGARFRVETWEEAQPALRNGLQRAERFLGLVALLSLVLGGLGVAETTRAWLAGRYDDLAVMRSIGWRPREVLLLYALQATALGLAGSLAGTLAGTALLAAVPDLLGDLIPPGLEISVWQPRALVRGLGLGLGTALVFTLGPLAAVGRVPPLRVLRKEAEPLPASLAVRGATLAAIGGGVWAAAAIQSRSWLAGLLFAAGLATAAAVLAGAALLLARLASRLPRHRGPVAVRHGLAALGRPGAATLGAVTALGVGVLLVVAMASVERRLAGELDPTEIAGAPTVFLIDIQPDQWPPVAALLDAAGARDLVSVPVVSARLSAVNGEPVERLAERLEDPSARWALTREQRLTWLDRLPEDNRVVAGSLWSEPDQAEVSLESEFAAELGVEVGDRLAFDISGVPVELLVTSLRTVDWGTFGINFFLVAEPGALDDAPHFRLATASLDSEAEERLQSRLAVDFPNVTLLRLRPVLEKIVAVLSRLALGVRLLGGFTVLAGIAILAGAVSAGAVRRGREVALLKTLGMTRRGVAVMLAVEYALVGAVAGLLGGGGGLVLAWVVGSRAMDLAGPPEIVPALVAVPLAAAIATITALLASTRALDRPPIQVLRGG